MTRTATYVTRLSGLMLTLTPSTTLSTGTGSTDDTQVLIALTALYAYCEADDPVVLSPAATAKVGIVFNVSVCLSVCCVSTNQQEVKVI